MEDVLDFSADFWEKGLESVDNVYDNIDRKILAYSMLEFYGVDPLTQENITHERTSRSTSKVRRRKTLLEKKKNGIKRS